MLWETSITQELYNFIYLKYNYKILNQYEVTFQKSNKIVKKFIAETTDDLKLLHKYFKEHFTVYQYVYATLFQKY